MCEHTGVRTAQATPESNGTVLGKPAREGESPYMKVKGERQDPEYHETRGTLWEGAGTTP